jgi:hypothetical protein
MTETLPPSDRFRFLFLAGLHRSGTSPLHRAITSHPEVSGFADTGVPRDEGQFLQSVYPPARRFGGPGRFGFRPEAHLTEQSSLATAEAAQRLFAEWSQFWDLSKPVLVEKSPPNILRSRFLQALFPNSAFVFVTRHPVAVALATSKWSGTSLSSLIEHWIRCHRIMIDDQHHLTRYLTVRYEELIENPQKALAAMAAIVGLAPRCIPGAIARAHNEQYFAAWQTLRQGRERVEISVPGGDAKGSTRLALAMANEIEDIEYRFEDEVRPFGYSFRNAYG